MSLLITLNIVIERIDVSITITVDTCAGKRNNLHTTCRVFNLE